MMRIGVAPDLLRSAPLLSDRLATWATVCDPQQQSDLDGLDLICEFQGCDYRRQHHRVPRPAPSDYREVSHKIHFNLP